MTLDISAFPSLTQDDYCPHDADREQIAKQTRKYLRGGGRIKKLPMGQSTNNPFFHNTREILRRNKLRSIKIDT